MEGFGNGSSSSGPASATFAGAEFSETELERAYFARRKRALEVVALMTAGILALSWLIRSSDDGFIRYIYPGFAAFFLGIVHVSRREWLSSRHAEYVGYALGSALVLSRLVWHFGSDGPLEARMVDLAGGLYWAVAILIAGGFMILDPRRGTWLGVGVVSLSALITAVGFSWAEVGEDAARRIALELIRVHFFLVAILAVISATAVTQQHLLRVVARAEVFERWAGTDELTGLPNRRAALRILNEAVQRRVDEERTFSVILVDLDHFKSVNDDHGHDVGDNVLKAAARRMEEAVRAEDVVTRWGGEEFLILCPGTDADRVVPVAERCRWALADEAICGHSVTATFGVSTWRPNDTLERLIKRADQRLYAGKSAGRNCVVSHHS